MKFNIITLFPDFCKSIDSYSIIGRAIKNGVIKVTTVDLRQFGLGKHQQVDDKPFGGGVGMLLRVDVMDSAINSIKKQKNSRIVLLSPQGKQFSQKIACKYSKLDQVTFVCGHYEGFDERIRNLVDDEISIGPYVLSGGEIPALAMIDAVSRQIPDVLGKEKSKEIETFSIVDDIQIKEYPQYTRPNEYRGEAVPEILISGNHNEIEKWKSDNMDKIA